MIDYDYMIAKMDSMKREICGWTNDVTDLKLYRHLINASKCVDLARAEISMAKILAGECDCATMERDNAAD